MSFYSDASLVMIPSGYKTSKVYSAKPTDGTGDLTFSRSNDTATRVASNGLIEKVRTNLALYSEEFDNAYWSKSNITVTANSTTNPINGATTADTIARSGGVSSFVSRQIAQTGIVTFSVFAKAGSTNEVRLNTFDGSTDRGATYNLTTGAITSVYGSPLFTLAQDFGSGWYRISIAVNAATYANCQVHIDSLNSVIIFGAQLETGDIATPYIATTTAAVSVGPVANVPRLDYYDSTCPRLLLEPQRVNYQVFSENSAQWTQPADGLTVAYNTSETLDPAGFNGAEKVTSTGGNKRMFQSVGNPAGAFSVSAFIKAGTGSTFGFVTSSGSLNVQFDVATGVVTNVTGTGSIVDYGNGWYRCIAVGTATGSEVIQYRFFSNNGLFVYFYGAQLEAGAYATSYIPTLGAAVTRGEDAASKTGISSLIGQTEGTLFADFFYVGNIQAEIIDVSDGTENNRIMFYVSAGSQAQVYVTNGGSSDGFIASSFNIVAGTEYKIAIGYKANDLVLYINGTQIGTDTSLAIPATSKLTISNGGAGNYPMASRVAQALLFKTRLTNAQLAELTA